MWKEKHNEKHYDYYILFEKRYSFKCFPAVAEPPTV